MCDSTSSTEQLLGDGNSRGGGDRCDAETKPEQCCMRWHLWMRPFAVTMYIVFVVFAVPWLVYDSVRDGFTRNDQLILVGGLCVLAAIPMSVWHIGQHMAHYTKPVLQKHIVRILWMVPIYALNAWLGLIFYKQSFYMDCVREIYEAYVIWNFMVYLLNYLNLEMDLERSLELKPQQRHIFPLCYMQPWRMGRELVYNCKHGIMQYAVLRFITTMIAVVCESFDVYGVSTFQANVAYPYLVAINNLSQFTAMYCLVLFYKANLEELRPMRPFPKFLCIKAVIFFSFFQSVIITFLVYYGYVRNIFGATDASDSDHKNLSSKLQNVLICAEMFVAAIAHKYSFPHEPFHINIPGYTVLSGRTWFQSLWAMCDVSDVHADVSDHFGVLGSSMVRRLRGRTDYQFTGGDNTEADRLLAPTSTHYSFASSSAQHQTHYSARTSPYNYRQPDDAQSSSTNRQHANRYGSVSATSAAAVAATTTASTSAVGHINIVKQTTTAAVAAAATTAANVSNVEYSPEFCGGAPPRGGGNFFGGVGGAGTSSLMTLSSVSSASMQLPTHDGGHHHHHHHQKHHRTARATTTASTTTTSSTSQSDRSSGAAGGGRVDTFTGLTTGDGDGGDGMRKSDSAASDWLSTPNDELLGIDVSGPEHRDLIRLCPPDPEV